MEFELSTTQKGKLGEALVASTLMLASNGRLSPFTPLSDDCGVDLIVLDKKTSRTLQIQVKCRSEKERPNRALFGVRKASMRNGPECYLLAFFFNSKNPALTQSWFMPMPEVRTLGVDKPDEYSIAPSSALNSQDRYVEYRRENVGELVAAILKELEPSTRVDATRTIVVR